MLFVGHVKGQNFAAASFALDESRAVHVREGTCGINVGDCTKRSLEHQETDRPVLSASYHKDFFHCCN